MPRVLLTGFCAVPGPRRAGVQMRHVIRALTPMHGVDLLVSREGEQAYVERQGSVRVLRVPSHEADPRAQVQSFQRALKRQLDGADYDVVHCRDPWSCIPVLQERARHGYSVVYDLARSPLGETTFDAELDAQYARDEDACLAAADIVLAPTPAAMKALQGKFAPERVLLSPPGVDVDRFDWEDAPTAGPPKVMYVGTIDPGRGVRVLVRAFAAIVKEVDARLVLAGTMAPKFEPTLRDGIRELGLTDKVEILAPVDHDQLPALLATATVCVVPAAADVLPNPLTIFPTKLLEYMACRRAVVAPHRDTILQVIDDGSEALLFEPGDPIDLARKVLRLLGEPGLRDHLAQRAYERVRRDFTASAARRALRAAYEVIADRFDLSGVASDDDAPKVELLADDDFEATVFVDEPAVPSSHVDTSVSAIQAVEADGDSDSDDDSDDDSDIGLGAALDDGSGSNETIAPPPRPVREPDETAERAAVPPGARDLPSGLWTVSGLAVAPPPTPSDDWVVTTVATAARDLPSLASRLKLEAAAAADDDDDDDEGDDDDDSFEISVSDDGTPIEGVRTVTPASALDNSFVAGEIEVPTARPTGGARDRDRGESPSVEFTAASRILGAAVAEDADTGSRTVRRS